MSPVACYEQKPSDAKNRGNLYPHLSFMHFGQIHLAIWQIHLAIWQIHLAIWTNTFVILDKYIFDNWALLPVMSTSPQMLRTGGICIPIPPTCILDKYIWLFGEIHLDIWALLPFQSSFCVRIESWGFCKQANNTVALVIFFKLFFFYKKWIRIFS